MDLTNHTPFPSRLITGSTGDVEMMGMVVTKVTLRVDGGVATPVPPEQAWPVLEEPSVLEGVTLGPDAEYRRSGVDLVVIGRAIAPARAPVTHLPLLIECGRVRHALYVFGDRWWVRDAYNRLVPSEPRPFVEMPLDNTRTFGGVANQQDLPLPHPVNPDGMGFHMSEAEAEGKPLPNVERYDALIRNWSDQPRPACLRRPKGLLLPVDARTEGPDPTLAYAIPALRVGFQQSVPELNARGPEDLGPHIRISGMAARGDILVPTPSLEGPRARASVGPHTSEFTSRIASIVMLVEHHVVVATYLSVFRYLFRPEELRSVELEWTESPYILQDMATV
jgi:hypothetical protein